MNREISVVLPVYDAFRVSPHYLPEAIESVLSQTVQDFELIIVDDASREDYGPLQARYADERIRWIRLNRNNGQSAARNVGVAEAKGAIVAFIDQDDRWYPERIEHGLGSHKECVMTYSDYDEIDAAGSLTLRRALTAHQPGRHPMRALSDLLEKDVLVLPGTCLVDRKTFLEAGGFDPELSGYEDDDFFLRIFGIGPINFVDRPLMQYRVYGESYRSSQRMDRSRHNYFEKLVRMFPDDSIEGRFWVRDKIASRFSGLWLSRLRYAVRLKEAKVYRTAREELRYTAAYGPFRLRLGGMLLAHIPYDAARIVYGMPKVCSLMRTLFSMQPHKKPTADSFWRFQGEKAIPRFIRSHIGKHKDLILGEARHMDGFFRLLMKQRNTGAKWTASEKAQLRRYIRRLVSYAPVLLVFLLPGSFFLIPLLAEVIDRRKRSRGPADSKI